jgi:hypothetical protein
MNSADEMAAKRQSAGAVAGSDGIHELDERLRAALEYLRRSNPQPEPVEDLHGSADESNEQRPSLQPEPVEDLHGSADELNKQLEDKLRPLVSAIDDRLDQENLERKAIYDRLVGIEREMKKRRSRGLPRFAGYLVAICIGVAATLAWQSYGEATKQIIATKAPELGWSPETKQMMASWMQQLGWTKPPAVENTAVRSPVPETPQVAPVGQTASVNVVPSAPAIPSIDPEQVHQIALDLAALRQTVEQLAAGQDQMARKITTLQTSDQEILDKIPAPPSPPSIAARAPTPTSSQPQKRQRPGAP